MGCSAGRREDDWKRWTLKDFSKWRCRLGGGENSWLGRGTGWGEQPKQRPGGVRLECIQSVTATVRSGLPLVLTAAPEAGITAAVSQDRKCVSERDRHLLPVAQLVSGRAEATYSLRGLRSLWPQLPHPNTGQDQHHPQGTRKESTKRSLSEQGPDHGTRGSTMSAVNHI